MRVPTVTGLARRSRLSPPHFLLFAILLVGSVAAAQQNRFGIPDSQQSSLAPPRIGAVPGPTAARLQQARALVADRNWAEAIDIYRQLAAEDTDRLVALDARRYVNLRTYCQLQLSHLPADAMAAYRRLVDPLAEQWYREGIAGRDEGLLRRVVEQSFCSSWGDDALLALGELALERADYGAARRAWLQVSPLLRSPDGRPMWIALQNIDLDARWPEIARRWLDRAQPPDWLAYPDTELDLADVRARLVLVSIRAGQPARAALELDVLRRLHPDAAGRVGGQQGAYAASLERLLNSAGEWPVARHDPDWPTFAGSPSRASDTAALGPALVPAWALPIDLTPGVDHDADAIEGLNATTWTAEIGTIAATRNSPRPLSCFPIVVDDKLLFGDGAGIHAAHLSTGEPAVTSNGLLHESESTKGANRITQLGAVSAIANGVPRYSLSVAHGVLYFRAGRPATTLLEPGDASADRIVGLDLARDGLLTFSRRPPGPAWSFDGVPVGDGRRLYVALRQNDVTAHAFVACFDASTGAQLWRTPIGAADTPAAGRADEITHNLLTMVDDRIFFNTNLGLVAALDAGNGRIDWLYRYDRVRDVPFPPQPGAMHFDRDPSPCLYSDGLLIVAPTDAPTIFALDAQTGQLLWATDRMPDALHLLGVVEQNLVVGGHRLRVVDVRSGIVRQVWPESEHAGIRGMGRGVVAGQEIYWPTRDTIYVISALTGERTRTPISLRPVGENGANLAAAHGHLIIAGHDKLTALAPATVLP